MHKEAAELQLKRIEYARAGNPNPISIMAKLADSLPYLDVGEYWDEGERISREYANALANSPGHQDLSLVAHAYVARFVSLQGKKQEADTLFSEVLSKLPIETRADHSIAKVHLFFAQHQRLCGTLELAEEHLKLAEAALSDIRIGTCRANPDDVILEFIRLYDQWNKPTEKQKYEASLREVRYSLVDAALAQ